ncbi:MAG: N-acetylneuraminate synthase family protein [Bacteroidota bacterium]
MIIAIIPAKAGSTRFPNKNMRIINGKSLIQHAVDYAKSSNMISEIIVSTDSEAIADHVKDQGVMTVMRGEELGGEAPLIEVYKHVVNSINKDNLTHVIGIQPDHPDRKTNLDQAIKYAIDNKIDDLFTLNRNGIRNGALRILSIKAINTDPPLYPSAIIDDCVNIHTPHDFYLSSFNLSKYSDNISVCGKKIGKEEPTFIIAEAACNHMCDIDIAHKMIDHAAEAGADAIKFQTYKAEKLVTKDAVAFWGEEEISQIEYYHRLDRFGKNEYKELFEYADKKGIIAFSSPFDPESSEMLYELGMPIFKIASCDICNLQHLRQIARYGKPIILSTGASTVEEIEQAVITIFKEGNYKLILLACTLSYPTKNEDANLARIQTLKKLFPNITIGLSDHTPPDPNMVIPSTAVALGARVIEKHYTLDRTMTGSGHFFAVNPDDLKNMVDNIRLTETVIGNGVLGIAPSEKKAWSSARRSIVAEVLIRAGEIITEEMLSLKRPADGLLGDKLHLVVGKKAIRDINPDERIHTDMLVD